MPKSPSQSLHRKIRSPSNDGFSPNTPQTSGKRQNACQDLQIYQRNSLFKPFRSFDNLNLTFHVTSTSLHHLLTLLGTRYLLPCQDNVNMCFESKPPWPIGLANLQVAPKAWDFSNNKENYIYEWQWVRGPPSALQKGACHPKGALGLRTLGFDT